MAGFVSRMLVRAADENEDGAVTKPEWRGFLESLNASEDGVIDSDGLARLRPSGRGGRGGGGGRGGRGGSGRMAGMLDKDEDGKVEVEDLEALFADMDKNDDGELRGDEVPQGGFGGFGGGRGERGGRGGRGGERPGQGRGSGPPQAGDPAPDFDLPLASDMKRTVKLSSHAGKKPVALIFGSYT